jgi:hypothetical protein
VVVFLGVPEQRRCRHDPRIVAPVAERLGEEAILLVFVAAAQDAGLGDEDRQVPPDRLQLGEVALVGVAAAGPTPSTWYEFEAQAGSRSTRSGASAWSSARKSKASSISARRVSFERLSGAFTTLKRSESAKTSRKRSR